VVTNFCAALTPSSNKIVMLLHSAFDLLFEELASKCHFSVYTFVKKKCQIKQVDRANMPSSTFGCESWIETGQLLSFPQNLSESL
jgi:hypothetical protein